MTRKEKLRVHVLYVRCSDCTITLENLRSESIEEVAKVASTWDRISTDQGGKILCQECFQRGAGKTQSAPGSGHSERPPSPPSDLSFNDLLWQLDSAVRRFKDELQ